MELEFVTLGLGLLMKLLSLYFVIIALFALKRPKNFPDTAPVQRFAVVVAARNEEAVIGGLVESLKQQDYPPELFDIYVVPNNCTDRTEEAAQAAGARILRPSRPVRCKGDALNDAFGRLLGRDYDVFVVFDADNVADPGFLQEMNKAFCAGAKVAKGRNEAANPGDSWVSGCYGIYFSFFDLFYNRGRAACGLSAKLVGTGFAVHRSVLEEQGWQTETIAEDAEFAARCALAGHRVWWVPGAVSWDEEPVTFRQSLIQRKRWTSGVMQVASLKLGSLLRCCGSGRRKLCLDFSAFLLTPFAQLLSLFSLLLTAVLHLAGGLTLAEGLPLLLGLGMSWFGTTALGFAVCLLTRKPWRDYGKAILAFPLFMVSWVPLQVASLFVPTTRWEITPHRGVRRSPQLDAAERRRVWPSA